MGACIRSPRMHSNYAEAIVRLGPIVLPRVFGDDVSMLMAIALTLVICMVIEEKFFVG